MFFTPEFSPTKSASLIKSIDQTIYQFRISSSRQRHQLVGGNPEQTAKNITS
jgi:hypothetical protein